jgi:hypothetical protein
VAKERTNQANWQSNNAEVAAHKSFNWREVWMLDRVRARLIQWITGRHIGGNLSIAEFAHLYARY